MPKTETVVDHSREGRLQRAKGRTRGQFASLIQKATDAWKESVGITSDLEVWVMIAGENEAIQNDGDVRAWMEENKFLGTVWPVRFQKGTETTRKSFTREVQQTFKTVMS